MATGLTASHFRAPARPSLSALPRIAKLAAVLGEACSAGLSALRAAPWQVTVEAVDEEELPAGEQERVQLRFESEQGSLAALMMIDRPAVSALVEAAMGGTGVEPAFVMNDRPLSKIETGVLRLAAAAMARAVAVALGDFMTRPFSLFEGKDVPELDPGAARALFRFVVNIYSYSGELMLVFARDELERQLAAAGAGEKLEAQSVQQEMLQREVAKAEIALTVSLPAETLMLGTLTGLRPGQMVPLASTAGAPVTIWSGGVAAYEATLGRSGDRFAVTILRAIS